jgi:ribosome modulation factor
MPVLEVDVPCATRRGRDAYVSGARPDNCPYPLGSVHALLWLAAWVREDQEFEESVLALCHQRGRVR